MGFAVTWCAIREEGARKLLDDLGLLPTGEREEFPESLISSARLDTGWRVIWYNQYECPFLQSEVLSEISKGQQILVCHVEEHVMASSSESWCGGKRKWRVSHEGENGPNGLSADGDLPACFATIRGELERAQLAAGGDDADVDYIFDIPLRIAQSIVGFKHDENCPHITEEQFVVLSKTRPNKGFFGGLFT